MTTFLELFRQYTVYTDLPFRSRIWNEYVILGIPQIRILCTDKSKYKDSIDESVRRDEVIITHKQPFFPSVNDDSPTFIYDMMITDMMISKIVFDKL